MPKINIDEICEPIEITINDTEYKVEDISHETMAKIHKITNAAQVAKAAADAAIAEAGKTGEAAEIPADTSSEEMAVVMAEILNAKVEDISKLGVRKLNALIIEIMKAVTAEMEVKNVPKAAPTK